MLDRGEAARLAALEEDLDFDTIMAFRAMAERQLRADARAERHSRRVAAAAQAAALVGTPSPLLGSGDASEGRGGRRGNAGRRRRRYSANGGGRRRLSRSNSGGGGGGGGGRGRGQRLRLG